MKLHLLMGTAAASTALYCLKAVSYYLKNCTHLQRYFTQLHMHQQLSSSYHTETVQFRGKHTLTPQSILTSTAHFPEIQNTTHNFQQSALNCSNFKSKLTTVHISITVTLVLRNSLQAHTILLLALQQTTMITFLAFANLFLLSSVAVCSISSRYSQALVVQGENSQNTQTQNKQKKKYSMKRIYRSQVSLQITTSRPFIPNSDAHTKKDRYCMYCVAFQHIHAIIAAMENQ